MTGLTAYVGLTEVGKPQPGETVVISAAARRGRLGRRPDREDPRRPRRRHRGRRRRSARGSPSELGFDAAVDYKAPDWREQLAAATPDGIDVDFENVGGEIMDAVFARLNLARPSRSAG